MIRREAEALLRRYANLFPVVTVTGPRQAGKTTLCRSVFPEKSYVSFEDPDSREFAESDPRGLLRVYSGGAVFDEVQRVPQLASYLQRMVDEDPVPGRFILTGSQHLGLVQSVSQSLAGRSALLELLPLTLAEVRRFPAGPAELNEVLWTGGYPAILDRSIGVREWLSSYINLYVERDVRQIKQVTDLRLFLTFLRLCAGRVGQLLNLSSLGADVGVSHNTANSWLSVLEASYLAFQVSPWFSNIGKRLIKAPKLYFHDTGLVCRLLGIETAAQLATHPLRGALFENWVVSEMAKHLRNRGLHPNIWFYRDRSGLEVDMLLQIDGGFHAVEIKSGETVVGNWFNALTKFQEVIGGQPEFMDNLSLWILFGGDLGQDRSQVRVVPWCHLEKSLFPDSAQ